MGAEPADEQRDEEEEVRVGLLADPGLPLKIAEWLSGELPRLLSEDVDDSVSWRVEVRKDPLSAGQYEPGGLVEGGHEREQQEGWRFTIVLTDLPLRAGRNYPLVADLDREKGVAGISIPALSGARPARRTREAVLDVIAIFSGTTTATGLTLGLHRQIWGRSLARLIHPIKRIPPQQEGVDERYVATLGRGRVRLLVGMVRSNEPWTLVAGLASALAGALAFAVFMMQSSMIWQMADGLSLIRLASATVGSIGLLVAWIIFVHGLWERTPRGEAPEETVFYNLSTVFTLFLGVLCIYAVVFVIILGAASLVLPATLLEQEIGRAPDVSVYLNLVWLTSSAVMIAGALGSTFESEQAVRKAAYGYRERRRREEFSRKAEAQE